MEEEDIGLHPKQFPWDLRSTLVICFCYLENTVYRSEGTVCPFGQILPSDLLTVMYPDVHILCQVKWGQSFILHDYLLFIKKKSLLLQLIESRKVIL